MATVTQTITDAVTKTVSAATASSTKVPPQGGILEGGNPTTYTASNPIILFIIQAGIIIMFCRLLHWPLSLLREPRVIAEIIGGVLLGPSVMGRIPGFTDAIFPKASLPVLSMAANLGLVLFLFLVGLEVDLRYFVKNWKPALSVGIAGMALPFGLGCAISVGLYDSFRHDADMKPIAFGTYMLFIGVALAITAFPVLCRILVELKLLGTSVGVIVLSAGVGNDVVGWILLALCVALVNAGSGLTALWVLLVLLGWVLFMIFAVRPALMYVLRRTNALQHGPSQGIVVLILLIALTSAFFTGAIGVHPIFGAFLAGIICPHDGGFAIKLTEKIEDLVSALLLPLYFAYSGLSTNLGLLDSGLVWGYLVGVLAVAFFAKFLGSGLAARLHGLEWRESAAVGALMSCKGLVELIVLNIGLQAKILSPRVFTMFVVMALITTFITTPLTAWLYPPWYQKKMDAIRNGSTDWNTSPYPESADSDEMVKHKLDQGKSKNLLVYLRLDSMPPVLALMSLFGAKGDDTEHPSTYTSEDEKPRLVEERRKRPVEVHGVRLRELNERDSTVMRVTELGEYSAFDPVLNAFRVLGQLFNLAVSGQVDIVPEDSFAQSLAMKASEQGSDMLILPWSETGSISESAAISNEDVKHKLSSHSYTTFVRDTLTKAHCNVMVFVNNGFSGTFKVDNAMTRTFSHISMRSNHGVMTMPTPNRRHHIHLPFLGGADGRLAIRVALQLAENPQVTATVVYYRTGEMTPSVYESGDEKQTTVPAEGELRRECSAITEDDDAFFAFARRSLPADFQRRIVFEIAHVPADEAASRAMAKAQAEVGQGPDRGGDIVLLGRSSGTQTAQGCLGTLADNILASGIKASVLVVQSRNSRALV